MSRKVVLLALLASSCGSVSVPRPVHAPPPVQACRPEHVHPGPHPDVRSAVVLVLTDVGKGSGFILSGGTDKRLIVTNYHVIEGSTAVMVQLESTTASQIVAEVVKVDRKNDLALLQVSSELVRTRGLFLSAMPVTLGQSHAVLGFPDVSGFDSQLTYELGSVAAARHLGERELIQSNANINPGNSGGPAIDGCGSVVGVATLKHLKADRVGLLVPTARIRELLSAYQAPPAPAAEAVNAVIDELFRAVAYRRNAEAAELFSREFLDDQVLPRVASRNESATASVSKLNEQLKKKGTDLSSLSRAEQEKLVKELVSEEELLAVHVAEHLKNRDISKYAALREFHVGVVSDDFGEISSHKIDRLVTHADSAAECDVQVATASGIARYRFDLGREWGDWVIRKTRRVR